MFSIKDVKKCIVHKDCPDGRMAALLVQYFAQIQPSRPTIEIVEMQYNTPDLEALQPQEGLLFIDFTPPRDRFQVFVDAGAWVIDHHVSMKDLVVGMGDRGYYRDGPGTSGASLLWDLIRNTVPHEAEVVITKLVKLIAIRDSFYKKPYSDGFFIRTADALDMVSDTRVWEKACKVSNFFRFLSFNTFIRNTDLVDVARSLTSEVDRAFSPNFWAEELYQQREANLYRSIQNLVLMEYAGSDLELLVTTDMQNISDLPDLIDKEAPRPPNKKTIVVAFKYVSDKGAPVLIVSMRTKDKSIDLSQIAAKYGGGGHRGAAGFAIKFDSAHFQLDPYSIIRGKLLPE